jgi:hypothetical protein
LLLLPLLLLLPAIEPTRAQNLDEVPAFCYPSAAHGRHHASFAQCGNACRRDRRHDNIALKECMMQQLQTNLASLFL